MLNVNPKEKIYKIILDNKEKSMENVYESDITFPFEINDKVFARNKEGYWEFGLVEDFNKNDRTMKIQFKPYTTLGTMNCRGGTLQTGCPNELCDF